ncbi:MAG: hypothetical protein GC179_00900 [Anaerolineaceae bacterium]|nr:hypothetical protein [Anaerolineaceae bacterium]
MDILLVLLRLLHIVSAVSWVALGGTLTLYIAPAAVKAGEEGYRYLKTLFTRTAYTRLVPMVAGTTTLAGILLYLVGNAPSHFSQTGNMVLGIGAAAGFIATVHGGAVTDRATKALVKALTVLPDDNQPIPSATVTELNTLAAALLGHARISMILMMVALVCMGSARYL